MAAWLADLWPNYVNDKRQIVGYFNWCENNHYISIYPAPTVWQPTAWLTWPLLGVLWSCLMFADWKWNNETLSSSCPSLLPPSSLLPHCQHWACRRWEGGWAGWFPVQSIHGWHQPSLTCKPAIRSGISSEVRGGCLCSVLSSQPSQSGLAGDMWALKCHNTYPVTGQVISPTGLSAKINISKCIIEVPHTFDIIY